VSEGGEGRENNGDDAREADARRAAAHGKGGGFGPKMPRWNHWSSASRQRAAT
jgi:hypothetical protein